MTAECKRLGSSGNLCSLAHSKARQPAPKPQAQRNLRNVPQMPEFDIALERCCSTGVRAFPHREGQPRVGVRCQFAKDRFFIDQIEIDPEKVVTGSDLLGDPDHLVET